MLNQSLNVPPTTKQRSESSTAPALELQTTASTPFDLARPLEPSRAHTNATEEPKEHKAAPNDGNNKPICFNLVHGLVNQMIVDYLTHPSRRGILSHCELNDACDLRHGQL